jgi:hypothetical protein
LLSQYIWSSPQIFGNVCSLEMHVLSQCALQFGAISTAFTSKCGSWCRADYVWGQWRRATAQERGRMACSLRRKAERAAAV